MFWEQRGIVEDVYVTRNSEMTKKPFGIHFKSIIDAYGPCNIINLLRYNTAREVRITTEYIRQVHDFEQKNKL